MASHAQNEVLSTLLIMGYDERYMSRAIKIHQKSKFGADYNLSLLVEIIDRLKKKDESKGGKGGGGGGKNNKPNNNKNGMNGTVSFRAHFSNANEAMDYIRTHNAIDFRFDNGRYILCKILDRHWLDAPQQTRILLHPASQDMSETRHNKHCTVYTEFHRLAPQKSVTLRKMASTHALSDVQLDDLIDINPMYKKGHEGWKHGQIIKLDSSSSQVKCMYYAMQENYSYWVHLENKFEAALHNTKFDPLKGGMMQSFNEYTDVNPLKRYTSLDAIDNVQLLRQDLDDAQNGVFDNDNDNDNVDQTQIIEQLQNFGYERDQILHALQQVPNASDINAVIEYMMNRLNKVALEGDEGGNADAKNVEYEIDYKYIVEHKGNDDIHESNFQSALALPKHNMGDFDNQLSSLAMGNELVMDDILAQMELGDDGQHDEDPVDNVHETPMGPMGNTPMGPKPANHAAADDDGKMDPNAPVMNNQQYAMHPSGNPLLNSSGSSDVSMHQVSKMVKKAPPNNNKKKFWHFGRKKNKKAQAADAVEVNQNQVFGVDAATLNGTRIAGKDYQSEIPDILIKLKGELFVNGGHQIEGIFRVAPQKEACKRVQDAIDKGNAQSINFRTVKGEIIANLIKLFYRQLPRNILQTVVDNYKIEACTDEQRAAQLIMEDVAEPQRSYLLWLLDLCCDIIAYEKVNKMSAKAISVVVAPNLYDACNISNPMKVMTLSSVINDFMQFAVLWRKSTFHKR